MIARLVQRLVRDERLTGRYGVHPIPDAPALPLERRVHHLECHLGRLWDHVWWMSLPAWKRAAYRFLGFRAPIDAFYLPPVDDGD